jgi:hypothetical protein
MSAPPPVSDFIRSSFRSVWALELLLHLKRTPERAWSSVELVEAMRGSALIVDQSLDGLMRVGLVSIDGDGCARFQPVTPDIAALAEETEQLYARKPETVRRIIVSGTHKGLATFADAFRLWKD